MAKLKKQTGRDMVIWGSISLAQSLLKDGLIDEMQLVYCPVVLGEGKPLFRDKIDPGRMKLLETSTYDQGGVVLTYGL